MRFLLRPSVPNTIFQLIKLTDCVLSQAKIIWLDHSFNLKELVAGKKWRISNSEAFNSVFEPEKSL